MQIAFLTGGAVTVPTPKGLTAATCDGMARPLKLAIGRQAIDFSRRGL